MQEPVIQIYGAREHNLKNVNLEIPRNKFVVITGLSGSGKSSLAFDTLYAEGQRRYIESLSPYARQFLEKLKKPEVDYVSGLSPSISIEQKQTSRNPRSTIATATEIYDYLRLLYAKVGVVHCYKCHKPLTRQSLNEMTQAILSLGVGEEVTILAPFVRERKGEYKKQLDEMRKKGFTKARIDGKFYDLADEIKLSKTKRHNIDLVVDRIKLEPFKESRILGSVQTAVQMSQGLCLVVTEKGKKSKRKKKSELLFSEKMNCPKCHIGFPEFTPNMFSFNSPQGACTRCRGIGKVTQIMESAIIQDETKPLLKGALNRELFSSFQSDVIEDLAEELQSYFQFDWETPWKDLPIEAQDAFFWGNDDLYGLFDELKEQFYKTESENLRNRISHFLREELCPLCKGSRLKKESLGVTVGNLNIVELCAMSLKKTAFFFQKLKLTPEQKQIAETILHEIHARLGFLLNVGLAYLTLDRPVSTLGGGEYQRIRLASQIGTGLTGVLYVLDEPSIGLHPRDHERLLATLEHLRDLHNTVVVVEHDEETIRRADHVIDLGPGAGRFGGELIGQGTLQKLMDTPQSLTGGFLSGRLKIEVPKKRKKPKRAMWLSVEGAQEHNLKNVTVKFPLGLFTAVTGVSGSGKSTLVHDILSVSLHNRLWKTQYMVGKHKRIKGIEKIDQIIEMDQSPIGRTPRSNPATYTDVFGPIRRLFSQLPEAKIRDFQPGRFSFNLKGGRCEDCRGEGLKHMTMSFLPDVYVQCETCRGRRYNEQTLEVRYKGKTIADVLEMSIDEACDFFDAIPRVRERLLLLREIGLGYLHLGQSSTTLSGGEAQRVKLACELGKRSSGKTLYILDEPTTGLHFADIQNLLKALLALRDAGNTVIVIEHNLDMVKMADYVVDLGPEGGEQGGEVIAQGSPEKIVQNPKSWTGQYLKNYLKS